MPEEEPLTGLSPRDLLAGGLLDDAPGGGERLGAYELVAPIGEGGMGVVYLAEQHEPVQREVALKLVKRGMDTDALLARFEMERQTLAALDHPGIARVFDAGATPEGRPYFVMELVEGEPVTAYCASKNLEPNDILSLFLEACSAVEHAHRRGVIHRDLKPSNLLVTADGAVKVIDFGLAKLARPGASSARTLAGEVFGTPGYMPPEQERGGEVDTRADVFALGKVLAELLGDPRGELRWAVAKATDEDPARRYGSVTALADDLRRFLDDRPLAAGPPTAGYRLGKFVRRHRTACAAGAALALGGSFGVWKAVESARFQREAGAAVENTQREWQKAHVATMFVHELLVALDTDDPERRREELRTAVHFFEENLLPPGGDPEGEFLAMEMLGMSYKALDEFADAERCLGRAAGLARELYGADMARATHLDGELPPWHPAEFALGQTLFAAGRTHEAAGMLHALDVETCRLVGPTYREREVLLIELAHAFDASGLRHEADAIQAGLDDLANFRLPPIEPIR